jgi:uncharacterized protein involved in exopolysaccharide biosynthesis
VPDLRSADAPALPIRDYLSTLKRARLLILVSTLAGALVALAGTRIYPRGYSAVVTVGQKPTARPFSYELLRAKLATDVITADTLSGLNLDKSPYALTPGVFLTEHLRVDQVPGSVAWQIRVTLEDPDTAVQVANRIGALVVNAVTEHVRQDLELDRKELEARMLRARARQEELAAVAVNSGTLPVARAPLSDASREKSIQALLLDYEIQAATRIYMDAFTQHEEHRLMVMGDQIGAKVLVPAVPNEVVSSPPPAVIITLGAALGCAIALALAIAISFWRASQDLETGRPGSRPEIRHVR